jgi:hypothetical protein
MAVKDFIVKNNTQMAGHITVGGYLAGPASFVIDPSAVGDNTGTVVIAGDLQVDGTQTSINSTTVNINDLNLTLADGAANASAANGAGLTIDGANATFTYNSGTDKFVVNKSITGIAYADISGIPTDHIALTDISVGTPASASGSGAIAYDNSTGVFTYTPPDHIALTDISVGTPASASGTGAIAYNNSNGVFTYTPPDLSGYLTSETFTSVVQDTTPQLGGDLDANGNNILLDNATKISFGSDTLQVKTDGSSNSIIQGSGTTYLRGSSVNIGSNGGSGGYPNTILVTGNTSTSHVEMLYGTNKKFETTSTGVTVTGTVAATAYTGDGSALTGISFTETDTLDSVTGRGATTTNDISVNTLTSTVASGTAPLTVTSDTVVTNLNADKLDGKQYDEIIAEATALAIALG